MINFLQQQSCLIFVENQVKPVPKVQNTAVIAGYGALHLDKIAQFNATNIKVLCTNSTTLLFARYIVLL